MALAALAAPVLGSVAKELVGGALKGGGSSGDKQGQGSNIIAKFLGGDQKSEGTEKGGGLVSGLLGSVLDGIA